LIVILTSKDDIVSDLVVLKITSAGGDVLRLNTEDPYALTVAFSGTGGQWTITQGSRCADSENTSGVWYRRPGSKTLDFSPEVEEFVQDQWTSALKGLSRIGHAIWVNDPFLTVAAENKILQLSVAKSCGFLTCSTVVTSQSSKVAEFYTESEGRAIVKALSSPWLQDSERFVFTNALTASNLPGEKEAALAPFITQELLSPKIDIRATVVGTTVLAAQIRTDTLDWRVSDSPEGWSMHLLPTDVERKCLAVCRNLGLVFGAIDLVLCNEDYYFLEINPNGEWAWIEHQTCLDISGAITRTLMGA
jgi:glutathione synthase/RimK-type ligase-like ATP-grasp enzyme